MYTCYVHSYLHSPLKLSGGASISTGSSSSYPMCYLGMLYKLRSYGLPQHGCRSHQYGHMNVVPPKVSDFTAEASVTAGTSDFEDSAAIWGVCIGWFPSECFDGVSSIFLGVLGSDLAWFDDLAGWSEDDPWSIGSGTGGEKDFGAFFGPSSIPSGSSLFGALGDSQTSTASGSFTSSNCGSVPLASSESRRLWARLISSSPCCSSVSVAFLLANMPKSSFSTSVFFRALGSERWAHNL